MKRSPSPRSLALDILDELDRRDAYSDVLLAATLDRWPGLATRDRALISQLVYGTLRWRNRLDHHLARFCRRPLRKLHPKVLQILRLGAYQILFLDRIPDRAAVAEAVDLTRRAGHPGADGLVNAVLRRVSENGPELPGDLTTERRLSLLFGCPEWLVEQWVAEYGHEGAESLCKGASRVPQLWLRVDPRISREAALARLSEAGIEAFPGAFAPESIGVGGGDPRDNPLVRERLALVQDQASQLVAHWVAPRPGWRVLDACAAPGLKATHLARLVGDAGRVEAVELHPHRAEQLRTLVATHGLENVGVHCADARAYRASQPFDAVLVDAPCSGLGVLHRTPEAKWRREPQHLATLPEVQRVLLHNLAEAVRPGGVLVYATCTTLRAENEAVVGSFLDDHPEFRSEPPGDGPMKWQRFLGEDGFMRTYPDPLEWDGSEALDGFFVARLRREEPT